MSKIGKRPIIIPAEVQLEQSAGQFLIKGPLGQLSFKPSAQIEVLKEGDQLIIKPTVLNKTTRQLWGTNRANLNNKIQGVKVGFTKELILEGLGYNAEIKADKIIFKVGYSHTIELNIPIGLKIEVKQQKGFQIIRVEGIDREKVGQFAAVIKKLRKADPYKLKGFRYVGEVIKRKAVKKVAK